MAISSEALYRERSETIRKEYASSDVEAHGISTKTNDDIVRSSRKLEAA
jgi:hypothetical protein